MQKQVTPAMIVVALIVLVIIIGLLWYFTMGRKPAGGEEVPEGMEGMDPAMIEEGAMPAPAPGGGGTVPAGP